MSDNHLNDRQRDVNIISSSSTNKYILTSTGESILYTGDLKDDEFQDENDPNQISILNSNDPEYEDDYANSRIRSNSLIKKKQMQQQKNTSQQPQQQQQFYSQMKTNQRNNKKTHHQGFYYQQPDPNEELEYYQDENEEFNDDHEDESFAVQQPLNRMNMQQKQAAKIVKSESHLSKPIVMSSSSNLNAVNTNQTRNSNAAHQSGQHHPKLAQNFSSPLKHPTQNENQSPKPNNNLNMQHHNNHHVFGYEVDPNDDKIDLWGHLLIGLSYFFLVFSFPFSLCACVKVAQEYERAVIFRLGRILQGGAKGPGIFFVLPCIDTYIKVDLRTVTFDVPPQEILTRDSVTVSVDAVVYFRIFNAVISVINVEDAAKSTKLLAASTLRNILGTKSLHEILSDRESVAILIQNNLDDATGPWGVKVERVEVKDVRLPVQLQRAMATEAEAAREARAKVIAAEGEQKASKALKEAAEVISESPIAIQLRYLQTLTQIASERNSTIVFPIPLEMLSFLANKSAAVFKSSSKT